MDDSIKRVLESTGLSLDDLLKKLQEYKSSGSNETDDETSQVSSKDSDSVITTNVFKDTLKQNTSTSESVDSTSNTASEFGNSILDIDNESSNILNSCEETTSDVIKDSGEHSTSSTNSNIHVSCDKYDKSEDMCDDHITKCKSEISANSSENSNDKDESCDENEISNDNTDFVLNRIASEVGDRCVYSEFSSDAESNLVKENESTSITNRKSSNNINSESSSNNDSEGSERNVQAIPEQDIEEKTLNEHTTKEETNFDDKIDVLQTKDSSSKNSDSSYEICCNEISSSESVDSDKPADGKLQATVQDNIDETDSNNVQTEVNNIDDVIPEEIQSPVVQDITEDCKFIEEAVVSSSIDNEGYTGKSEKSDRHVLMQLAISDVHSDSTTENCLQESLITEEVKNDLEYSKNLSGNNTNQSANQIPPNDISGNAELNILDDDCIEDIHGSLKDTSDGLKMAINTTDNITCQSSEETHQSPPNQTNMEQNVSNSFGDTSSFVEEEIDVNEKAIKGSNSDLAEGISIADNVRKKNFTVSSRGTSDGSDKEVDLCDNISTPSIEETLQTSANDTSSKEEVYISNLPDSVSNNLLQTSHSKSVIALEHFSNVSDMKVDFCETISSESSKQTLHISMNQASTNEREIVSDSSNSVSSIPSQENPSKPLSSLNDTSRDSEMDIDSCDNISTSSSRDMLQVSANKSTKEEEVIPDLSDSVSNFSSQSNSSKFIENVRQGTSDKTDIEPCKTESLLPEKSKIPDNSDTKNFDDSEDDVFNEDEESFETYEEDTAVKVLPEAKSTDGHDDKMETEKYKQNIENVITEGKDASNSSEKKDEDYYHANGQDNEKNIEVNSTHKDESSEAESGDEEEENSEAMSLEDDKIRDCLKLQLTTLRNRRKEEEFKIDSKAVLTHTPIRNPKKKLSNDAITETCGAIVEPKVENDLFVMTGETDLLILNVRGGIEDEFTDVIKNYESGKPEDNVASSETQVKLTKTNDITKIKGWKNKKFTKDEIDSGHNSISNPLEQLREIISKNKNSTSTSHTKFTLTQNDMGTIADKNENTGKINRYAGFLSSTSIENELTASPTGNASDNSPFVSNKLDEFLNSDLSLNISYDIPKLHAEEGVTNSDAYDLVKPTVMATELKDDKSLISQISKPVPEIKAKTLAEKRRMLAKLNKEYSEVNVKKESVKMENKEENPLFKKYKLKRPHRTKFPDGKYGFILYNGRKLWLPAREEGICLSEINDTDFKVKIEEPPKKVEVQRYRRPSLLNCLHRSNQRRIHYKPGPLREKIKSFNAKANSGWESCVKRLPQVYLDVIPEYRKPIPYQIQHLVPNFGWEVNDVRINYALAALRNEEETSSPKHYFRVPVHYANNQQNILVRKRLPVSKTRISTSEINEMPSVRDQPTNLDEEIKLIVEDLLKYIEIKEIEDSVIQEDEPISYDESSFEAVKNKPSKISENISTIVRKSKKKRKVDLELLRLNCKVVNVTVEEADNVNCNKPYCQLGCVCHSLGCDHLLFPLHCKKPDCMFGCKCPKPKSQEFNDQVVLPAGTDLFSNDAVSRIDDRAKRNLAKVEREFTQTIICSNDKTIVVSAGGRDRIRRATKTPKKYTDFDEDFDEKKCYRRSSTDVYDEVKKCHIPLVRLELDSIVPYCLVHEAYDCSCKGIRSFSPVEENDQSHPPRKDNVNHIKKISVSNSLQNEEPLSKSIRSITSRKSKEDLTPASSKLSSPHSKKYEKTEEGETCARIKKVFPEYMERNKTVEYVRKLKRFIAKTTLNLDPYFKSSDRSCYERTDAVILKEIILAESMPKENDMQEQTSENGQLLSNSDKAIQRRRKYSKCILKPISEVPPPPPAPSQTNEQPLGRLHLAKSKDRLIFEGEVDLPVDTNSDFLQVLGLQAVSGGIIKLLSWVDLLSGYKKKTIQIARHFVRKSHFVVYPSTMVNIAAMYIPLCEDSSDPCELMTWLREGIIPVRNSTLYAVLIPLEDCFHMKAFCLKSSDPNSSKMVAVLINRATHAKGGYLKRLREAEAVMLSNNNTTLSAKKPETVVANAENITTHVSAKIDKYVHKNMEAETCIVNVKEHLLGQFGSSTILEELRDTEESFVKEESVVPMEVWLPKIDLRWRMIYMRSDFTFLLFKKSNYSIKYTDLKNIIRLATATRTTVSVHSKELSKGYKSPKFGIYISFTHGDRIFVGPYHTDESHELATMRYMQKSLVDTDVFNKMQGKPGNRIGVWLKSKIENSSPSLMIDLTTEDSPPRNVPQAPKIESTVGRTILFKDSLSSRSLLKRPAVQYPETIVKKLRFDSDDIMAVTPIDNFDPSEWNNYIVTNIPHLGYIAARLNVTNKQFTVAWTIQNRAVTFKNSDTALKFLEQQLLEMFQPVPDTFKIKFIIMTNLQSELKPIDKKYLNGHYICGEFGVYNVKSLTKEIYEQIGCTREEIIEKLFARERNEIMTRMYELGGILQKTDENTGQIDTRAVLQEARREISHLRNRSETLNAHKTSLYNKKNEQLNQLMRILQTLPQSRRLVEYNKLKSHNIIKSGQPEAESLDILDNTKFIEASNNAHLRTYSVARNKLSDVLHGQRLAQELKTGSYTQTIEPDTVDYKQKNDECIEIVDSDDDSDNSSTTRLPQVPQNTAAGPVRKPVPHMLPLTQVFGDKVKLKRLPTNYTLQSVLKSNISPSKILPKSPLKEPIPPVAAKLVKAKSGQFIVIQNKPDEETLKTSGVKFVIKDSKVVCVRKLYDDIPSSKPSAE